MHHDSYKAWIDATSIDDVRRRIERIERKLSDLQMLERLYADRSGAGSPEAAAERQRGASESPPPEGGGWTHGEGEPQHG
jgi:hypothetical protein